MRRLNRIFITLALVIIFLVAEIIIIRNATGVEEKAEVLFAARKIQTDELITDKDLRPIEVPREMAHKLAVKNKEHVVGRRAKTDIEEGEMIFSTKLCDGNDFNGISIEEGSRLFTLDLKGDQANGWQLKAGQRVDIIFVRERNSGVGLTAAKTEKGDNTEESTGQQNKYQNSS